MGFKGKDDWLFFRGEVAYLNSGDMSLQAPDKNPIPHLVEFAKFLKSKNISLIFAPVPNKSDVYFEKLPVDNPPKDLYGIVNPYARKMLRDLQNAGIEVIDLLPAFLSAKKEDAKNKEAVYQRQDTHWTDRGLEIAAQLYCGSHQAIRLVSGRCKIGSQVYDQRHNVHAPGRSCRQAGRGGQNGVSGR